MMENCNVISLDLLYNYGDEVFLKSDRDQLKRIVTGFILRSGTFLIGITLESKETWHYQFEVTKEKDVVYSTSN